MNPVRRSMKPKKTKMLSIDITWSIDISELFDKRPKVIRGHRCDLVVISMLITLGWTFQLKSENAQSITNSFENYLKSYKQKPNLMETDDGSELVSILSTNHSKHKSTKRFSRNSSLGAVFAERLNRTNMDFLKKPNFKQSVVNWVDELSTISTQKK